jgi:hypothetical protein
MDFLITILDKCLTGVTKIKAQKLKQNFLKKVKDKDLRFLKINCVI